MNFYDTDKLLNLSCDEPSDRYGSGCGSGGGYGSGCGSGSGYGYCNGYGYGNGSGSTYGYGYGICDTPEIIEIINTGHAPEKASLT